MPWPRLLDLTATPNLGSVMDERPREAPAAPPCRPPSGPPPELRPLSLWPRKATMNLGQHIQALTTSCTTEREVAFSSQKS